MYIMPKCEVCEKEFIQNPNYRRPRIQRYCSDECRQKGWGIYIKNYMAKYWKSHNDKYLKMKFQHLTRQAKIRQTVIEHYGAKCSCCGENHIEFLTIDHINGGGNRARKTKESHISTIEYYRVLRENFPVDIQVLCMNCNWGKRSYVGHRNCPVHHPEEYKDDVIQLP